MTSRSSRENRHSSRENRHRRSRSPRKKANLEDSYVENLFSFTSSLPLATGHFTQRIHDECARFYIDCCERYSHKVRVRLNSTGYYPYYSSSAREIELFTRDVVYTGQYMYPKGTPTIVTECFANPQLEYLVDVRFIRGSTSPVYIYILSANKV